MIGLNVTGGLKFKVGDKVKCIKATEHHYIKESEIYTVKGFKQSCLGNMYVVLKEIEREHSYELDCFELIEQTPKNYRELTPDTLIDISIDGNEFKVPLGDLIHAKALIGVANGLYGYSIFKALKKVFDKDCVIINNHKYSLIRAVEAQDSLMKTYFIDKEKEAKKQALKEVIEKQREEIAKLEQQLIALDDYDGCSL